jgi:hypothetical protein
LRLVGVGVWLAAVWGRHIHYPLPSEATLVTLDRRLPARYRSVRVELLLP